MRRIAIVGWPGAGKSRLARELGRRLGLPVVHLDAAFWRPGWVPTPRAEWIAIHEALVAREAWVMDGNYDGTLDRRAARAEAIVFLDVPRRAALRGVLGRVLAHWGRVRPDMGKDCPEKVDAEFLRWIWRFRRDVRPAVLASLAAYRARGGRVVTLRGRREVAGFLARLPSPPEEAP